MTNRGTTSQSGQSRLRGCGSFLLPEALGLTLPLPLLARADEVIE